MTTQNDNQAGERTLTDYAANSAARDAGHKLIVPTMFSDGLSVDQFNSSPGDALTEVKYRGFNSYGFFRGSVRFPGDPEPTQVYSCATDKAAIEWQKTKQLLALNLAMRRMLRAEATIRDLNKLA